MGKRWIWLGAAAVIGVGLIAFGPDALDLYRLGTYVAASNKTYEADGPWPHLTDVCAGCHLSVNQGYPSLLAQPAPYVAAQLHNFAAGKRISPNMQPLAMSLSDAEIAKIADYFARQPATPNSYFRPDPALQARGKALVTANDCAACHGESLMGHDQAPRLAGQGSDYLTEQLDAFAAGGRTEDTGTMNRLAKALSPADRKAVATYLAALTPVNK